MMRLKTMLSILMLSLVAAPGWAQSSTPAAAQTFQWSGELAGFDSTTRTMTIKPRIAYEQSVAELKQFKPGDRVLIVWSGGYDYADAVWRVRRAGTSGSSEERLIMPAELVSTDAPNQQMTIRLKVPEDCLQVLKNVTVGQWVTVTSPRVASSDNDAVLAVRPFASVENQ